MTAAHCVDGTNPSSVIAVVGERSLDISTDGVPMTVSQIVVHPNFNSRTLVNDIALLKLSSCMPAATPTVRWDDRTATQLFTDLPNGEAHAAVIGLGTLSSGGSSPRILQEARVTILTHSQCVTEFDNAGYNGASEIDEATMICGDTAQPGLGYGDNTSNVDTCQGDSGGPFTTRDPRYPDAWVVIGLVSWGYGCAGSTPGVYTRVSNFAGANGWIQTQMTNLAASCTTSQPTPSRAPTAPTTPPTSAPTPDELFTVTSASPSGACFTTQSGSCFTDGSGSHGNNEACTIRVNHDVVLSVSEFDVETYFDYVTINGVRYSGNGGSVINAIAGQEVAATSNIYWNSDYSVVRSGFTICGTSTAPTTSPPTDSPTTT